MIFFFLDTQVSLAPTHVSPESYNRPDPHITALIRDTFGVKIVRCCVFLVTESVFSQSVFPQSLFLQIVFFKVYFCKMNPTCVSSKLCEFIFGPRNVPSNWLWRTRAVKHCSCWLMRYLGRKCLAIIELSWD